jgi:catechol 2,3-dioxygenase-like lactoylglutathione lyase family enzyme
MTLRFLGFRRLRTAGFFLLPVLLAAAVIRPTLPARPVAGPAPEDSVVVSLIGITVSNLDRSVEFYTRVLGFEQVSEREVTGAPYERLAGVFGVRERVARLRLGGEQLELTEYLAPRGRPMPAASRSNDRWFQHVAIIVSDMDNAYRVLRHNGVQHLSTGPQRLPDSNPNAGGIKAFYFADPDGHALEILQFPPDKGDPKWHRPSDRLFLGIDHTAIVVRNTEASLKFYRDELGMHVAGESWNSGTEQEHLNNVKGARLHITGLRGTSGPGIEFLEYLAPTDGRAYPLDERPNDLVHWQTRIAGNLPRQTVVLRHNRARFLSDGVVTLPDTALGFARGLLVRDPDGHVVQLVDR